MYSSLASLTSPPWNETELEETVHSKYPLQETMELRRRMTEPLAGTEETKTKYPINEITATEQHKTTAMESEAIMTGDTVQQMVQCMKLALRSQEEGLFI